MLVLCTWIWSSTTLYDYENLFLVSHQKHSLQPHSIPNFQRFQCYLDILQTCIHHLQIFDHTFTLQQSSEYWMPSIHILQNVHVLLVNLQTVVHLHFHACKMFDTIHTIDAGRTFTNLCILTISDELLNPSEHLCDAKPLGIVTGNPGSFQPYPYPYPQKPLPQVMGMGFGGYGLRVWWVWRVWQDRYILQIPHIM